jgi:hypothetical protein
MSNDKMSSEKADAIMRLSADLIEVMHKVSVAYPDLDWLDAVSAASLACRGIAANVMSTNPDLDLDTARKLMLVQFARILSAPADIVRVVQADDGKDKLETFIIPARKH